MHTDIAPMVTSVRGAISQPGQAALEAKTDNVNVLLCDGKVHELSIFVETRYGLL